MKQPVGIIEVVDGIPVRQDDAGTLVEVVSEPYILTDGVSLEAPIPVTFVDSTSYVDTAGNLRGVWPVTTGAPSPVPGPLDFGGGEMDLTTFETAFDVAAPHVVMGMFFYYTGTPEFTVTHEGEPLDGRVQLNGDGQGCLLFIGDNLTVETGALKIECTGGTFGPFYGRVNEMPFAPNMATLEWINENFQANSKTTYHDRSNTGRVYGIVSTSWWNALPSMNRVTARVWARDYYGEGLDWTPSANNATWTWDGTSAIHTGTAATVTNQTMFADPTEGDIRFRADLTDYTDIPTTTYIQYQAIGSGASNGLMRTGDTVSGRWNSNDTNYNSFQLRFNNDVTVQNLRFYDDTTFVRSVAGVIASGENTSFWSYSSSLNTNSALISLWVEPA